MTETPDPFTNLYEHPAKLMRAMFAPMTGGMDPQMMMGEAPMKPEDAQAWAETGAKLQTLWAQYQAEQMSNPQALVPYFDPARWMALAGDWYKQMPIAQAEQQKALWEEGMQLWNEVLGQYGLGPKAGAKAEGDVELPRKDRRFADEKWRAHPAFALIHQTYLFLAERVEEMADNIDGLNPQQREQLKFTTKAITEAASPANFPLLNPVVMERTLETKGQNLVKGMEHLLADMRRGQLSHTDASAFTLGENIATTPGKIVHETPLYQLIQYSPTTEKVMATPLVIFPPWINRFYILDLNEKKSFVRWAVEQGVTVFMVSWKSADASMKDVIWDDYVRAQMDAIDHIRTRLDVPSVHAIGYCVAGTTLAATLALLHRRGEEDKVRSATFFTAQVDFEKAGELLNFIDDGQLGTIKALSPDGYLDGRYMAATFNLLRGTDLIWNYVVNNYLLGEDYPAFDLLHWNGDVTNLPAKWHQQYLRDLYRDNRLVEADALEVDGTPVDLGLIKTPTYVQAGKEDHIAPAESVWRMKEHFTGPLKFVLAGSGHIAGVVNPPSSGKYQYWLNDGEPRNLAEFRDGAVEHKGSWWPDWVEWLREQDGETVPATGKRKPGGKGDKVVEDAPGRYVATR
ncbi:class I poly(R)-hydroxyalkanoic acid synthase [Qipengyuania sp. 1NDH17]|uniref:Class I poly(R)-hydroxyalkanoic acid synthase n=1 Tax=Qipengyuania polymorpha TaxID=2867234 RepID=A0ABS7IXH5_9SPHN|nr:class I poly(R)-hydroxyalkanoic acid synthase [Qipengyuania polymorpha]MBX7458257.1 class I poly(R)-hydroxyalkanoic acid synthase [Qipengyuania polymorpha]